MNRIVHRNSRKYTWHLTPLSAFKGQGFVDLAPEMVGQWPEEVLKDEMLFNCHNPDCYIRFKESRHNSPCPTAQTLFATKAFLLCNHCDAIG